MSGADRRDPGTATPDGGGGTLVVGFDGSEASARAARWAIQLARPTRGHLVLVFAHHRNDRLAEPLTEEEVDSPARAVEYAMGKLVQEAQGVGVSAAPLVREGAPAEVLLGIARETSAVGIVVGSRGLGGAARLLLGSVSSRLVTAAAIPVTVVP